MDQGKLGPDGRSVNMRAFKMGLFGEYFQCLACKHLSLSC